MKIFHCDHCGQLIYFENHRCVKCDRVLAYLPDLEDMGSLDPAEQEGLWVSPLPQAEHKTYRLCSNYSEHNVCNWAVPSDDPNPLCASCRLTRLIPDLNRSGHKELWYKLEIAKRRLIYTLSALKLPVASKLEDPAQGMFFEFRADPEDPNAAPVLTGHALGVITINLAEADDAEREKRRVQLYEPYRTLLGHFRHEIGHYYWDRLIQNTDYQTPFRELFGDEQADYNLALQKHYASGPPADWQQSYISAYATVHPWEDWAESWTHYLHMVDTLETASISGLSLRPHQINQPAIDAVPDPLDDVHDTFDELLDSWLALTHVLNNLNRGLGLQDGYPFVLSVPAINKLRFIHDLVTNYQTHRLQPSQSSEAQKAIPTLAG